MEEPLEPLDEVGVRVLGSLIEKEFVTPDSYPLTLNALIAACNQTSNRDPVMDLDEATVSRSLEVLGARRLVRAVHRGDWRAMRYRQEMGETLHLHRHELAALCVLMLRGPQTLGEIRTRSTRLFQFIDVRHVEITVDSLMTHSTPLVTRLPRRPGQKEARYAHLLSGEPRPGEPRAETAEQAQVTERTAVQEEAGTGRKERTVVQGAAGTRRLEELEQELGALRAEVAELRAQFEAFRKQFE